MESLPQYFILTLFAITKGGLQNCQMTNVEPISTKAQNYDNVICGEGNFTYNISSIPYYRMMGNHTVLGHFHVPQYYWFAITYNLTLISCTFAILKFLDVGPTRIFEKNGWRNYVGNVLAFVSVLYSLITKTRGLGTGGSVMHMLYDFMGLGNIFTNLCVNF